MNQYIKLLLLLIILTTKVTGQGTLTNFFESSYLEHFSEQDQLIITHAMNDYFKERNIIITSRTNCNEAISLYDQKEMVSTVTNQLKTKIEDDVLSSFINRISTELYECQLMRYFILEKNGRSVAENEYREQISYYFGLSEFSENGREIFLSNYHEADDKIFFRERTIGNERIRVDSIRILSRIYFRNTLIKKDSILLDNYWAKKEKKEFKNLILRDSLHKEGLKILKYHVDSLVEIYRPRLQKEKSVLISQLDSTDLLCLHEIKTELHNKLIERGKKSYEGAKRMYIDLAPNMWYGLDYNHNLMKKYPSVQFARNLMRFRSNCNASVEKLQDLPYIYMDFEKELNKIVLNHTVAWGTLYYNKYDYNENYKKTGLLNMLLYYLD